MARSMRVGEFTLDVVSGGSLRLDGGTMFGPVPRVLWEKKIIPDERHRIPMQTNCLLIHGHGKRVLVDAGYGSKADARRRDFQGLQAGNPIVASLADRGLQPEDVHVVVLTHLHFDHVGGCTQFDDNGDLHLVFPNAEHVVQRIEWEDAIAGLPELAGSYFAEDFLPIERSGRLRLVDGSAEILPTIRVRRIGGHTRGMQAVEIGDADQPAVVCLADLVPTTVHVKAFWQVSYDQFPLDVRRAKPIELGRVADADTVVHFCHDVQRPLARIRRDPKQEFVVIEEA